MAGPLINVRVLYEISWRAHARSHELCQRQARSQLAIKGRARTARSAHPE